MSSKGIEPNNQANSSAAATKPVQSWRDHPADDPLPPTGLELPGEVFRILAQHADAIRFFRKRAGADLAEIGLRLKHCRTLLKEDGSWRAWLEGEFKWSPQTAGRFIQVHELLRDVPSLEHLELPVSALYLLAAPSTPVDARDEIIVRAEAGETLPVAEVNRVIEKAKGRKQSTKRNPTPQLHREAKLGANVVAKLAGTSLGNPAEMDGAEEHRLSAHNEELLQENHRLGMENERLREKAHRLEHDVLALRSQVDELKAELGKPSSASDDDGLGIPGFLDRTKRARSRGARWSQAVTAASDALRELSEIQGEYQNWRDSLPENLAGSATSEKLDEVCDLDLDFNDVLATLEEAEVLDLPVGFGRD